MIYGLSERIKDLRVQKGLTQVQVAQRLGITKNAVNAWESSASSPSLKYIVRLAKILGISTDYLLGMNERLTVDISDLSVRERKIIIDLAAALREKK